MRTTRLFPLLAPVAVLIAVGCQPAEYVVLLDLTSQQDVASMEVRVLSLDATRPTEISRLQFTPARTVDDIADDPIRVAVRLEGPALVMVHVIATTPGDPGETLVATRCYGVDGVIEDTAVLVGPIGTVDLDGDTFLTNPDTVCREAVPGMGERACDDFDFVCPTDRATDCDDANRDRHPGAAFVCQNGIDEDCDGMDEPCGDQDGDGFEGCSEPPTPGCDCDDTNPNINPGAAEANTDPLVCNDGIDQNCDGAPRADGGVAGDVCCDLDGDGYEQCVDLMGEQEGDCVDFDAAASDARRTSQCARAFADSSCDPAMINPGASEEPVAGMNCDGIDNNCNGIADDSDACRGPDLDGDGVAHCGREAPGAPCDPNDCDTGIRRGPGSREICGNSIDENGDGTADSCDPADTDGDGDPAPRDCNDMDRFAYNHMSGDPVFDLCVDMIAATCVPGEERDCSGDTDGDGYVEPPGCEGDATRGPLVPETCNGVDDDCDGNIDEVLDESGTTGCVDGMMIDFQTDRTHCGVCRNFCMEVGNQDNVCVTGMCDCPTEPGVGQCTGTMPACCTDGCQDLVDDELNCGACGASCGLGESCVGGVCTCGSGIVASGVGQQACPDPGDESSVCCGTACRDVTNDNVNCGDCDFQCGAHSSCISRFCQCDAGGPASQFDDCAPADRLSNPRNNGCETDIRMSLAHCGGCGLPCAPAHANPACNGGMCEIDSCIAPWDNCNGIVGDGCEINLSNNRAHCGNCTTVCGFGENCTTSACRTTCGDGQKAASEGCDDNNTASNDGCSSTCTVEGGWTCSGTAPSSCSPICGDGQRRGSEACDDNNTSNGDGCSSTCTIEGGWACSGTPSSCSPICGDGQRRGSEACDDNNTSNGDGCSSTCTIEGGWTCSGTPSSCSPICGDGQRRGSEACDDNNTTSGDGCSSACAIESGWTCSGTPSSCSTICGDGLRRGAEACDDNNTSNGDGCSSTCTIEGGWTCSGSPSSCAPVCGDGQRRGSEACDDNNTSNGDGCSSTCTIESGWSCSGSPSSCMTICGDGLRRGSEACDDNDTSNGDGCSSTCTVESGWSCTAGSPSSCTPVCGNGMIHGAEACDDNNTANNDGCSSTCTVEIGWTCSGTPSSCSGICGDGLVRGTEVCDDQNTSNCGTCNMSCSMVRSGGDCAAGVGCNSNAVCTSDSCVSNMCE